MNIDISRGWHQSISILTAAKVARAAAAFNQIKKKILLAGLCLFGLISLAQAGVVTSPVSIYVDAAPNVYGSPNYAAWKSNTFAAVVNGTFVNMTNGINPANVGTTNFEINDEVVYSFGDLGKRLSWIYWVPGATVSGLTSNNRLMISLTNIWDGSVDDFYNSYFGSTWLQPTHWENYQNGVIGVAGMAWWGAYGANTPAALASDIADWRKSSETWIFKARLDGKEFAFTSNRAAVPEPAPLTLLAFGLLGLGIARKRRR